LGGGATGAGTTGIIGKPPGPGIDVGSAAGTARTGGGLVDDDGVGGAPVGSGTGTVDPGGGITAGARGAERMASFSSWVLRRISSVIRAASTAVPMTRGVMSSNSSVFSIFFSLNPKR
jgi:hypothetical protein